MSKPAFTTALVLQMSTDAQDQHHQILALADRKYMFRRSIRANRTAWGANQVADLAQWLGNYVTMGRDGTPTKMPLAQGLALIEVTADEVAKLTDDSEVPVSLSKRFQAVVDGMVTAPGVWPVTPDAEVQTWVESWIKAEADGDTAWLEARVHPDGKIATAAPAAPATHATTPKVDLAKDPQGRTYPAMSGDFISRPNGDKYRVRKIEGMLDVVMLRRAQHKRRHVFLRSEPGTGKTALVEAAFGKNLVTMIGTEDTEKADFLGGHVPTGNPDSPYLWVDGPLIEAMERGVPFFFDECGVVSPKTPTILYPLMDGRDELLIDSNPERGVIKAAPGFFVICATNPNAPGVRMSEAFLSRMLLQVDVTTDYDVMTQLGVPEDAVLAAKALHTRKAGGEDFLWVPQARELLAFRDLAEDFGQEVAIRALIGQAPNKSAQEVLVEVIARSFGGAKRKALAL